MVDGLMEVVGVKSFDNSVDKWEITKHIKICVTNGSYKYEMTTAKVQRKLCLMSSSKHIMDFVLFLIKRSKKIIQKRDCSQMS